MSAFGTAFAGATETTTGGEIREAGARIVELLQGHFAEETDAHIPFAERLLAEGEKLEVRARMAAPKR